ncbi:MAG: hypothetical protein SGJ17_06965 [Hyphomicrobiales bacterium]|nr:hypothetical protein [Hyphomicrobiales bacterium]
MLFDEASFQKFDDLFNHILEVESEPRNHWDESWDEPLNALKARFAAARPTHDPVTWRAVVIQGRALRAALEVNEGHEHRLYVAATRLTDSIDGGLDAAARDGRGIIPQEHLERLMGRVESMEKTVIEDREERQAFELDAKRLLDEVLSKVGSAKRAIIKLENVVLKPSFSILSTGLAEVLFQRGASALFGAAAKVG